MKAIQGFSLLTITLLFMFLPATLFAEDPDYGNDSTSAEPIATDYTWYYGEITSADEDWFVFTPAGHEMLRVWFAHTVSNWMNIYVYQADALGTLVQVGSWSVYNDTASYRTYFLEYSRPVYLRVYSGSGAYGVAAEFVETVPPDAYADTCADATALAVGTEIEGTLDHTNPTVYDQDWFVFDTEPLHKYRIQLWHLNNTNVSFRLLTDDCASQLHGNTSDMNFMSWYGEQFRINVNGSSTVLGNWYGLIVTDLGEFPDDYGNTWDVATAIPTDGTEVYGNIDYEAGLYSDDDWLTFTPMANSRYEFSLDSEADNWRSIRLYQENEFGTPIQVLEWSAYGAANPEVTRDVFFEYDRPCYLQIWSNTGGYHVTVEYLETILPDSYPDACADASTILPDGQPVYATLDHPTPATLDTDWFLLHTQPLHKYQIALGYLSNSYAHFRVLSGDCASQIFGHTTSSRTFVSWYGDDFRIELSGQTSYVGNYYWLVVTDLGEFPDDHGNTWDVATEIPKNGTEVPGAIEYLGDSSNDIDWFTFIGGADGDYTFTLNNPETAWKNIYIYRANDLGQPVHIQEFSAYNKSESRTWALTAARYWIQVTSGNLGDYLVSVVSPEPQCGDLDHPFPPGDANQDCYLNLLDIAILSQGWLTCTDPLPPCLYLP